MNKKGKNLREIRVLCNTLSFPCKNTKGHLVHGVSLLLCSWKLCTVYVDFYIISYFVQVLGPHKLPQGLNAKEWKFSIKTPFLHP